MGTLEPFNKQYNLKLGKARPSKKLEESSFLGLKTDMQNVMTITTSSHVNLSGLVYTLKLKIQCFVINSI